MLLAVLLSGENADTQRQGKESMARGILLERLSQLSRTVQNGGFSWQPGSATQQGAFQYLMENVLTHPSADIGMKVVTEKNRPAISPGGSLNFSLHNFKVSLAIRKNPLVCKTQCLSKEGLKA